MPFTLKIFLTFADKIISSTGNYNLHFVQKFLIAVNSVRNFDRNFDSVVEYVEQIFFLQKLFQNFIFQETERNKSFNQKILTVQMCLESRAIIFFVTRRRFYFCKFITSTNFKSVQKRCRKISIALILLHQLFLRFYSL